ncbi:probable gluconokinase [Syngnathus scovelli]|uniref:probable gluconokinase n=1 Tax=Syngnathus scovelli TaxID=161590 RepID=UPI002110503C|nr:probable gluconokinase [Syngnathus scovelli]XP_049572728.1 probable gluconokinase [Syngnathus scovelli]XP_049572729.1 probable gluconokinase [Syngnathus scovelli]XP_049572730.1 probable gluconokinase [Syngnathus scovelli]
MIYIIMGVSGCGKSSLGAFLSEKLGWPLHEGDRFHPEENVAKMARGEPLTDQDRFPWLLRLHDVIERERCSSSDALVTCSALKRLYRLILLHGPKALPSSTSSPPLPHSHVGVFFLFLHGDYEVIHRRMMNRRGHFMKADLLHSQFEVLEHPVEDQKENVVCLDVSRSIPDMAVEVEKHLISLKSPKKNHQNGSQCH